MAIKRIMVQLPDQPRTLEATHLACQIARLSYSEIVFVKMVPVQHVSWLGTAFGDYNFTMHDRAALRDCAATAEDYGVSSTVKSFQYISFVEGIYQAAICFDAQLVFATPVNPIPFIQRRQSRALCRLLAGHGRQLADANVIETLLPVNSEVLQPTP